MPRMRYLKPGFFKDEDLVALPFWVRILFAGLWVIADRDGRLEDRPKRIKVEVFPYDDVDIEDGLVLLAKPKGPGRSPFINRYLTDNEGYIEIVNWFEHQRLHHTEKASDIPKYTKSMKLKEITVKEPLKDGEKPEGMGMGMGMGMGRKDPPPSAQSLRFFDNLVKETTKGIGTVKPENPKAVDLKDVVVKHGDQELGEPAKHKLHNSLIKLFHNRGWNPKLIKSVMRSCAERLADAEPNGDIYPYYEKIICKYVNENADLLAAENKKMVAV